MSKKIDKTSSNFNKIMKSFKDKWVAVSPDYSKVFASANTLNGVINKIGKDTKLKIFKVVPLNMIYSPFN